MSLSSTFLLLLVSFSAIAAESENVLVLTESNFDSVIAENEFVLVKFYAPWCGHCKSLAPKYDEAADQLLENGATARLAKVDATENQALAAKFEVRGYPTLLFFRNGKPTKYTGGRDSSQIVDWVNKKSGPSLNSIDNIETLEKQKSQLRLLLVANLKEESDAFKAYKELSDSVDDVYFGVTSDEEVLKAAGLESEGVTLFRKEGDDAVLTTIKSSEIENSEQLKKWIGANKLAAVTEFTSDTASDIVGGEIKQFHFLIASKGHADFANIYNTFTEAANKYRGKLVFVLLNIDLDENARILDFLGVATSEIPTSRIVNLESDVEKFKPATGESYEEFTDSFLDGKASQDLKSQPLPEDWDAKPVKVLVSENFHSFAHDESKALFVKFYAPWCGHCKKLVPVWDELAEKYESNPNVVIAKLDSTLNELTDVKIQSFPTLKFWPIGSKTPVEYDGDRTLDAFVKFIDAQLAGEKHDEL